MQISDKIKHQLLMMGAVVCSIIVLFLPPIAQDLAYHNFADKRGLWGVPNFGDVMSNIPYFFVGLIGLLVTFQKRKNIKTFIKVSEKIPIIFCFIGIALVSFGSGYYHWNPSNSTLFWDRLPMTIGFMGVFSMILLERINVKLGLYALLPLIAVGIFSVFYWCYTEQLGRGDLRLYALVQFFPLLAGAIILLTFKPRYTESKYIWYMILWYIVAKFLEYFDKQIFEMLNQMVSGHSLKHLASAFGTYMMVVYIKRRISAV